MIENFINLVKDKPTKKLSKFHTKKSMLRHITIKLLKTEEREKIILKAAKINDTLPKGNTSLDCNEFLSVNCGGQRPGHTIFQVMKEKNKGKNLQCLGLKKNF